MSQTPTEVNPAAVWDRIAPPQNHSGCPADRRLNVTVVYEDDPTRQWAGEVCTRVASLVGKETFHSTWWRLGDLSEPAVLAGAVSTTLRADVIIVAIHAAEGFPLPFYVWVDSWLPYKRPGAAALVALITLPEPPTVQQDRARAYLRTVAQQGRLDFLLEERKLAPEAPVPLLACAPMDSTKEVRTAAPKRAKATLRQLQTSAAA